MEPLFNNPTLQQFFAADTYSGLSNSAYQLAQSRPELAAHIVSVGKFADWLKNRFPQAYDAVAQHSPALLDPASVTTSGALSAVRSKRRGLSGLSDYTPFDPFAGDPTAADIPTIDLGVTTTDTSAVPQTSWGSDLINMFKTVVPAVLQAKAQNDLINVNISRAEKGLPPIDASALAPQVNVGVSSGVQTLGYLAIGAVVLVGLASIFGKRTK